MPVPSQTAVLSSFLKATVIEDFEDGNTDDWTSSNSTSVTFTAVSPGVRGTSFGADLQASDDSGSYLLTGVNISEPDEFRYFVRIDNQTGDAGDDVIIIINDVPDDKNIIQVVFFGNGNFRIDSGQGTIEQPTTWSANTLYQVKYVFDWSAETADIFLNDTLVFNDYAFGTNGTPPHTLESIRIINDAGSGATVTAFFDEFRARKF